MPRTRICTCSAVLLILCIVGCKRPETNVKALAFGHEEVPVQVEVALPGRQNLETEQLFAEILRDHLSNLAIILPASTQTLESALLRVEVKPMGRAGAVGETTTDAVGSTVGLLWDSTDASDPRDALGRALLTPVFAVFAAPVGAVAGEGASLYQNARLGYKPRHLKVSVLVRYPSGSTPCEAFTTDAFEVVKAMRPLSAEEVKEPGRLRKEEARALALVIEQRLREAGWSNLKRKGSPPEASASMIPPEAK